MEASITQVGAGDVEPRISAPREPSQAYLTNTSSQHLAVARKIQAVTFDEFCLRLEHLRRDKAIGPVKPYKPLLLAAVVLLIAKRKIATPIVFLDGAVNSVFQQLLFAIYPDWRYRADIRYPFRHLEGDGIWELIPLDGTKQMFETARLSGAKARELMKFAPCARMDEDVFQRLEASADDRQRVLGILVARYLPPEARLVFEKLLPGTSLVEESSAWSARDLTERFVEESLFRNWGQTPFAEMGVELATHGKHGFSGRQTVTPASNIDLLGFRPAGREWWVIELKRGYTSDAVVGQVSRYVGWITEERTSHGEGAVGAVVTDHADARLRYAIKANPRLSLWLYDSELRIQRA